MKQKLAYGAIALFVGVSMFVVAWKANHVLRDSSESSNSSIVAPNKNTQNSREVCDSMPELKCQSGWQEYHQETLGIAFCYPPEWGTPSTEPIKNLTRLANMEETFKEQNIYYEDALDIVFEKKKVRLKIFNDRYDGKSERDINEPSEYAESGSTDQVVKLKNDGDICGYETSFKYKYYPEMREQEIKTIFSECSNGVKVALTDSDYIGYDLKLLSFKKLGNGYFDNVLVSQSLSSLIQRRKDLANFGDFLSNETTKKDGDLAFLEIKNKYHQERVEFEQFIATMTAFKPVPKTQGEFKQIPGEDPNITTIRKYYWLIASGKLNEAYAMYVDKVGTDRNKFQERYKNAYSAEPFDFKNLGRNRYEFSVRYQDQNSSEMKFRVVMNVAGDTVRTIFLEEYKTDIVPFGNMTAYSARRGDKNYVFLKKNGKEIIIDQGDAQYDSDYKNISDVKFFFGPRFSPDGNYLVYTMAGWEWSVGYIYDIQKNKKISGIVASDLSGASVYEFTENEKNFYLCSSAGLDSGSGGGKVYSVPGFKVVYDVMSDAENKNYTSVDCSYKKDADSISFKLSDYSGPENGAVQTDRTRTVEYKLTAK